MIPSLSSFSSSYSSSLVIVEKATSELLVGPDWSINMEICDLCNSNQLMAKDVVKGVKRRLQHKNPRVQLLTLTLLETLVKNCGEYIHFQFAERKLLDELIKIVKKKGDMNVRNKILIMLDSWQEAFGGPGGKYSQYYRACEEIRRYGVQFPDHPERSAPVITPPVTQQPIIPRIGFDMSSYSSQRLDEPMTSEVEGLSFSTLESMRSAQELLNDMLQAVNPSDRMAVKNEVIMDLVDRCRANEKELMQIITTTTTMDEDLLSQGLEMNDSLQNVLAKHDAIASGAPLPDYYRRSTTQQSELVDLKSKPSETGGEHPIENDKTTVSCAPLTKDQVEEEEEEDEFALLARRHSKAQSGPSQSGTSGVTEDGASSSGSNNALALIDTPSAAPASMTNVSKDQDLIDLLSIVLTTSSLSEAPKPATVESPYETSSNGYVVPWAQPQPPPQPQPQPQPQQMVQSTPQLGNHYQPIQPQMQQQTQQGYLQYASTYPPPPWEVTSGYNLNLGPNPYMYPNYQENMNNAFQYAQYRNQPMNSTAQTSTNFSQTQTNQSLQHFNSFQTTPSVNGSVFSSPEMANTASSMPMQGVQSPKHTNTFPSKASNTSALNGTTLVTNGSAGTPGQKPFIPSHRLFEDLNVFGSSEGKLRSGLYPNASGNQSQRTVLERR